MFYFVFEAISKYKPCGRLIFGGAIKRRVFCVTSLGGYISRGLYMEGLIFGILRYFQVRFVLIIIIIVVCKLKDYICYALMLSYFAVALRFSDQSSNWS